MIRWSRVSCLRREGVEGLRIVRVAAEPARGPDPRQLNRPRALARQVEGPHLGLSLGVLAVDALIGGKDAQVADDGFGHAQRRAFAATGNGAQPSYPTTESALPEVTDA